MSSLVESDPLSLSVMESNLDQGEPGRQHQGTNLLEVAWRSRWLILLCTLLGAGIAWALLQRVTPRYLSVSRVYVEKDIPRILEDSFHTGQAASYLHTQAELMVSTPVLAAVANIPEIAQLETFREVDNRVVFLKQKIEVEVGQNDDIINVSTELPNAEDAAQLVNAVVDAYVTNYADNRRTNTVKVLTILRNEKQRRDAELEQRRQALADFREQHTALAVQVNNENIITHRYSALSEELNKTEIALLQAKALYNRVQKMYDTPGLRPLLLDSAGMQQQSMRDMSLESQMQLGLERQIQEIELRITAERSTWGDGHPRVKLLRESLAEIQKRLTKQEEEIQQQKELVIESYVDTIRQEFELLEHKRNELQLVHDKQYELAMEVSTQALQLEALQESQTRTEKSCDILDDSIQGLNLTEGAGAINVNVFEVAGASAVPSYPKSSKFMALGVLLGGLTGFGLAWLRDLVDHRLRSIDEITSVLQLPILGALPYLGGQQNRSQVGQTVLLHPRSMMSEAFRTLRTAIHFGITGDSSKVIAITSPLSAEGKSVVASNLAITLAQVGRKVLLVDADFRMSSQHEIFEIENAHGLSSVLTERQPVDQALRSTSVPMLDLLPSGPPVTNPVELLNNGYFDDLMDELRGRYDRIVIDSPPVLPVADARIIAALSDSVLLVLQAESSNKRDSLAARDELWQVGARRLGIVINQVPGSKQSSYGHGFSDQGYYGNDMPSLNDRSRVEDEDSDETLIVEESAV